MDKTCTKHVQSRYFLFRVLFCDILPSILVSIFGVAVQSRWGLLVKKLRIQILLEDTTELTD